MGCGGLERFVRSPADGSTLKPGRNRSTHEGGIRMLKGILDLLNTLTGYIISW
jgi:hypothetical protein